MQRRIWTALAAAVVACTGGTALAQVVGNPGFEDPIIQDVVTPGNWSTFYGGPATKFANNTTAEFHTGTQSFHLYCYGDLNSFAGAQQTVTGVVGNGEYEFKFWGKAGAFTNGPTTAPGVPNGIDIKIEWVNLAGGNTGVVAILHPELTSSWTQFTLTATAPSDAVAARLVFAIQSYTFSTLDPTLAGAEGFFDDATFALSGNQPTLGTCCGPALGECLVSTQANCTAGGTWISTSASCTPNPCPGGPGACCNPKTGSCAVTTEAICGPLSGKFSGSGTVCSPNTCPAGCPADFNGVNGVTIDDLFLYLNAYFVGC